MEIAIHEFIFNLDQKEELLTPEERVELTHNLTNFITDAVHKYRKGKKEHGGNITDRDLNKEIDQEIIDLFWYHTFNKKK